MRDLKQTLQDILQKDTIAQIYPMLAPHVSPHLTMTYCPHHGLTPTVYFLDGHHVWETEAKVDKDSFKSVSIESSQAHLIRVTHEEELVVFTNFPHPPTPAPLSVVDLCTALM